MNFIDNNPEQIVQDILKKYEEIAQYALAPADAERLMIDIIAYREMLLRASMERAMRQNFVQTADGSSLDYWGALLGVARIAGQTDDAYRTLILAANQTQAQGTRSQYLQKIKSIATLGDVLLFSKQDDPTLPPGVIQIVAIEKQNNANNISSGIVATPALKDQIKAVLSDQKTGLIGDMFVFEDAQPIAVNGSISIRKVIGTDDVQLREALNFNIDRYFGALSLAFDAAFGAFDLERAIAPTSGISRILAVQFPDIPILRTKHFYQKGTITLTLS